MFDQPPQPFKNSRTFETIRLPSSELPRKPFDRNRAGTGTPKYLPLKQPLRGRMKLGTNSFPFRPKEREASRDHCGIGLPTRVEFPSSPCQGELPLSLLL